MTGFEKNILSLASVYITFLSCHNFGDWNLPDIKPKL